MAEPSRKNYVPMLKTGACLHKEFIPKQQRYEYKVQNYCSWFCQATG